MIIEETIKLLKDSYRDKIENLTISDAVIGLYLTAVRLSDNSQGIASTTVTSAPVCSKANRDFGDYTPMKINGKRVIDILESDKKYGLLNSLKTAVLNAISSEITGSGRYRIEDNTDPVDLIDLGKSKTISLVGAFQSYINRISSTNNRLYVLEMREDAFTPDQEKYFVPSWDYKRILSLSDIVIITGQTLVNDTLDELLKAIPDGKQVIVTGPTSGLLPDFLFAHGVSIIGTLRITKPEYLFNIVAQGGTGYHLFEYCARKICILRNDDGKS